MTNNVNIHHNISRNTPMRLVFLNSIGCLLIVETPPAIVSENVRIFLPS